MDYSLILEAWVKGCYFQAVDENGEMHPEDKKFKLKFTEDPLYILENFCKMSQERKSVIRMGLDKIMKRAQV